MLYHEPDHDQAQYWIVARDMNLSELFTFLRFSGHPALWFFILMPFAKTGMSFFIAGLIHWLLISVAAGVFLFKSPFGIFFKTIFVFSFYMVFEYVVDFRDYNLTIVLLFFIASLYPVRFENKILFSSLVFFLFNSNLHSFGAAIALLGVYVFESYYENKLKQRILPIAIMFLGFATLVLQLFPSSTSSLNASVSSHILPPININSVWAILTDVQNAFIPVAPQYEELKVALLFFAFLLLILISFSNKKYAFAFVLISIGWLLYLFSAVQSGGARHEGLILVFIIFSLWIQSYYPDKENYFSKTISGFIPLPYLNLTVKIFLSICLIINVVFGIRTLQKEFKYSFSGAKEAGQFISKNIPDNTAIACYTSYRATAVAPYISNRRLWFADRKEYGTYFLLDSIYAKIGDNLPEEEVLERCKTEFGKESSAFLMVNKPLSERSANEYSAKLLFENKIHVWETTELFWIYQISFLRE